MKASYFLGVIAACIAGLAQATEPVAADYLIQGGRWFNGEAFEARSVYVVDGRLADHADSAVETIDLQGGHVVPPFCEAHNHNLGGGGDPEGWIARYLRDGVFYVQILSNIPAQTAQVRPLFNRPDSVDVRFANGSFTSPGGHPIPLRERLLDQGIYPGFTRETLADHAYFAIETRDQIAGKFDLAMALRPDLIKLMLVESDLYAERSGDPAFAGRIGLDPAFLPDLVATAHQRELRVAAHVDTLADLWLAVDNDVDQIAHLPGYNRLVDFTAEDARRLAASNATVITTQSFIAQRRSSAPEVFARVRDQQRQNLRHLRDAGVRLAIGSDVYDDTSVREAAYLFEMGVFTNAELLRMWTSNCTETAFPNRRIGRLQAGYEASFLVLADDPLKDWTATGRITRRFKEGRTLSEPAVTSPD